MSYLKAQIIADSIDAVSGVRITTFKVTIWKLLLAELNTHRVFSKSAASSRAVPARLMRQKVLKTPFIPTYWVKNGRGMHSDEPMTGIRLWLAKASWRFGRYFACAAHWLHEKLGVHKQITNRWLEPWLEVDVVITSTEWDNFFKLRCTGGTAQGELRDVADDMRAVLIASSPKVLQPGQWHLPFTDEGDTVQRLIRSWSRCARASYSRAGAETTFEQDLSTCTRLWEEGHYGPAEHQAMAAGSSERCRNYRGWKQLRHFVEDEKGDLLQKIRNIAKRAE